MIFLLGIFVLTVLPSSTLAQYNYDPPLKRGGYNYLPPEVPFNEAPPSKSSSDLQVSTSAPKLVDKTSAPDLRYKHTKPNVSFTMSTPIKSSITSKPLSNVSGLRTNVPNLIGYEYPHPAILFTYPSINSKSNPTPVSSKLPETTLIPTFKPKESVLNSLPSLPKSTGYTYPHPVIPFTIPKEHPTTVPTPQPTTDYSYATSTPSMNFILDPSIAPITSTNTTHSTKTNGYTYTRPSVSFTIPPRIIKDKPTQLPKFKGYFYPKPKMSLTLPNIFLKSKDNIKTKQSTFLKTQTKAYTEVTTNRLASTISPTPSTGYSYSPPEVPFTLPPKNSIDRPSEVQITHPTSSSSKSISYPETSPLKQANGYVYSRPDAPFKTPTSSTIPISSPLPKSNGYSYRPPDITFTIPSSTPATNSPTKMLGYSYKPPKVPFTTPKKTSKIDTPPSSMVLKAQKQTKPVVNSNFLGPPEVGYSYPKPSIPFGF